MNKLLSLLSAYSLCQKSPEDFVLAVVFVDGERTETYYISQPFECISDNSRVGFIKDVCFNVTFRENMQLLLDASLNQNHRELALL